MKHYARILIALAITIASTTSARAQVVSNFVPFSLPATTVGFNSGFSGNSTLLQLDPFDSTLGSLDEVEVSLSGNTVSILQTGLNYFFDPAGLPQYVPYLITTDISFDIDGLSNNYFSISPDITGRHLSTATGSGSVATINANYNLDFTIDAASELTDPRPPDSIGYSGGTLVSFPFVSGTRADFLDAQISTDLLLLSLNINFSAPMGFPVSPTSISTIYTGLLQVDYHYTPAPIPVPATAWLLATALIGLWGFGRQRKSGKP